MESYLVFGRTDYAEPLREIGVLEAEGAGRARGDTLDRYGSEWVELSLVPEADVVWVLRPAVEGDESDDR